MIVVIQCGKGYQTGSGAGWQEALLLTPTYLVSTIYANIRLL